MCSYPFLVRLVQIGELQLGLGVLEPRSMLEIMNEVSLERSLKTWGVDLFGQPFLAYLSFLESLTTLRILQFRLKKLTLQVAFILILLLGIMCIILTSSMFFRVILKCVLF